MPRPIALALLALAACAQPAPDAGPDTAAQVHACAAIVGPHVGMAPDAVPAKWDHATPGGNAVVLVGPPARVHTCEVTAGLQVVEVLHPDA